MCWLPARAARKGLVLSVTAVGRQKSIRSLSRSFFGWCPVVQFRRRPALPCLRHVSARFQPASLLTPLCPVFKFVSVLSVPPSPSYLRASLSVSVRLNRLNATLNPFVCLYQSLSVSVMSPTFFPRFHFAFVSLQPSFPSVSSSSSPPVSVRLQSSLFRLCLASVCPFPAVSVRLRSFLSYAPPSISHQGTLTLGGFFTESFGVICL